MSDYTLHGAALECLRRLAELPSSVDVDLPYRDDALLLLLSFGERAAAEAKGQQRDECAEWCLRVMERHAEMADAAEHEEEKVAREMQACGAEDCCEAIRGGIDRWLSGKPSADA